MSYICRLLLTPSLIALYKYHSILIDLAKKIPHSRKNHQYTLDQIIKPSSKLIAINKNVEEMRYEP